MGKNLIQQARGKGSPTYRSPSFRFKGSVHYGKTMEQNVKGIILDLIHCAGHSAPLASVKLENGSEVLIVAGEGLCVGESIDVGPEAVIKAGSICPLKHIPEGTFIYNIEIRPGDGGKICRASGTFGRVVAKMQNRVMVLLPSKKEKPFLPECRASIGIIAGGGRLEKPFYKAGNRYHAMRAKNKLYPRVSGVAMNAVDHPFGGSRSSHKGRPTTISRNAPPGRKVGMIAARRTGRKKR